MSDPRVDLKLFVVGESSGDPDEWSGLCCRVVLLAESPEAAARMALEAAGIDRPVYEVGADVPRIVSINIPSRSFP